MLAIAFIIIFPVMGILGAKLWGLAVIISCLAGYFITTSIMSTKSGSARDNDDDDIDIQIGNGPGER